MSLSLLEANKINNKKTKGKGIKKEIYQDFPKLVEKVPVKRTMKPRKSNYKKQRSWWENQ